MTTRTYDRWVFDLDGTLVDVEPGYIHDVFDRVGDRLDRGFTAEQAETVWHGLGGPRNDRLASWGVDVEAFWKAFHAEENGTARAEATFLHDDAAVVGELTEPTVLVTHCQRYLTDPVLDVLDIRDWFDAVVCCTEEIGWKPDPRPVRMALREAGAESGDGVLVGDGPHDVGAAWNAGLDGAHVERHGHEQRGLCVVGDHRLERIDELVPS
ncbi:HAD family hydrolase [Halobacteriales archaeon QS_8_69_73]|nr:MAG: HAD family hydrolase [Halobacteriales archaeon QS_8_69_73]